MSNLTDKTKEFLVRLYKATENESINWHTGIHDEDIETSVGELTIKFRRYFDENTESSKIILFILDKYGSVKDRITEDDVDDSQTGLANLYTFQTLFERLYDTVFRLASGAPEILDSLLDDLPE